MTRIKKTLCLFLAAIYFLLYSCNSMLSEDEWYVKKGFPSGITLSSSSLVFRNGDTTPATLDVTFLPEDTTERTLTWASSDQDVAMVDQNGCVTPRNNGAAIITARTGNGKEADCHVRVLSPGQVVINFDSGVWDEAFTFSGDADWIFDRTNSHTGSRSARSGNIGTLETSTLLYALDIPPGCSVNTVSFYSRISSEGGCDILIFSCDSVSEGQWSGIEASWSQRIYTVNLGPGAHTLEWTYSKDGSVDRGSDCAWIDDIEYEIIQ